MSWDTPASRKMIRCMMRMAIAANLRDTLDLGPELVRANEEFRDADREFRKAMERTFREMRLDLNESERS